MKFVLDNIHEDKVCNMHPRNRTFIYVYRLGHYFYTRNSKSLFSIFFRFLNKILINQNNHIPLSAKIGAGIRLPHLMGIVISGNVVIGRQCTIFHQVTIGVNDLVNDKAPHIGDDCYIGAGAKLIGDIKIGDHVKIGANAIVTVDVPSHATVVGINKIVKTNSSVPTERSQD